MLWEELETGSRDGGIRGEIAAHENALGPTAMVIGVVADFILWQRAKQDVAIDARCQSMLSSHLEGHRPVNADDPVTY